MNAGQEEEEEEEQEEEEENKKKKKKRSESNNEHFAADPLFYGDRAKISKNVGYITEPGKEEEKTHTIILEYLKLLSEQLTSRELM